MVNHLWRARLIRWLAVAVLIAAAGVFAVSDSPRDQCSAAWQDERGRPAVVDPRSAPDGVSAVDIDGGGRTLHLRWQLAPGKRLFGLGERFGPLNLVGQVLDSWAGATAQGAKSVNSYSPTPFILSSRGYGLLLDTTAAAHFDLGAARPGCLAVDVAAPQVRL